MWRRRLTRYAAVLLVALVLAVLAAEPVLGSTENSLAAAAGGDSGVAKGWHKPRPTATPIMPNPTQPPPTATLIATPAPPTPTRTATPAPPTPTHTAIPTAIPTATPTATPTAIPATSTPVTLSATPTSTTLTSLGADTFARGDQPYWGTASDGQTWGADANSNSVFKISSNAGVVASTAGIYNATLGPTATDQQVLLSGSISSFSSANFGAVVRFVDTNNWYKGYIDGSSLVIQKKVNGTTTILKSVAYAASPGTTYWLRFQIVGTTLSASVWPNGSSEPAGWLASATDATFAAGYAGLRAQLASGTTVSYRSLSATSPSTSSTPSPTPTTPAPTSTSTPTTPTPTSTPATPTPTSTSTPTTPPTSGSGFVQRSGTHFVLDGQPFRFVGINEYEAANTPGGYTCHDVSSDMTTYLDQMFQSVSTEAGGKVLRFWAFQSYTNGGTDWTGIDRVIATAKANGFKVIPVLENQWADCTLGGYKYDTWYSSGYKSPYGGYALSYRDYVGRIVARYKNEPTIMAWMLMNEAESKSTSGASDPTALYNFTVDMSGYIKSLDPNHLVTLGVLADQGQPGTEGDNFTKLHAISTIDFAEVHDYGFDTEALPGSSSGTLNASCTDSSLACNMARALLVLGKPFVIGEAGIKAGSGYTYTLSQRASLFDAKIAAQWNNGGSGYLIWWWQTASTGYDGYAFGPGDPLNSVLYKYH